MDDQARSRTMPEQLPPEDHQARLIRRTYLRLRLALLAAGVVILVIASFFLRIQVAVWGALLLVLFFLAGLSTAEAFTLGRINLRTRRLMNLGLGVVFIIILIVLAPRI
jgi:FtsH-binding integral membrane protein